MIMHVLLIEDNEDDACLIRKTLADRKEGRFNREWADHLGKGLIHMAQGDIETVLLDPSWPGSQGLSTFDTMRARALGSTHFLAKGCSLHEFGAALNQIVRDFCLPGSAKPQPPEPRWGMKQRKFGMYGDAPCHL